MEVLRWTTGGVHPVIGVLGSAALFTADGAVETIPSGRQREILTILATRANSPVSSDQIIEALWAGAEPRAARNTLHVHISALRRALAPLGRTELHTVPGGYQLDVAPGATDLSMVAELVRLARAAREAGRHEIVVDLLGRALGFRRGIVLADAPLGFEGERARWESVLLNAEDDRAAALMVSGRESDAIALLEQGVREQRLREHRVGLLALALHRTGRQAEALALCRRTRQALRDELGCEPGRGLVAVEQVVLTHADGHPHPDRPWRAAAHLVGRDVELERVSATLAARGWVVLVGPAGVGKSAIARATAERHQRVTVVDLADLGPAPDLPRTLLSVAGGVDHPALDPLVALRATMRSGRLLVLDNVDRSHAAVGAVVAGLGLDPAGSSTGWLIVTSRRPLGLVDEPVVAVSPLVVPGPEDPIAGLRDSPCAQLLLGARARWPDDEVELMALAEVARLTGGLPLVLGLASARLRSLGSVELARQLGRSVAVLDAPCDGGDDRHRTLAAALEWSIDQLAPEDRRSAAILSVFAAPFTLNAAESMLAAPIGPIGSPAASVARLVDHGLLVRVDTAPSHFNMLPPIRSVLAAQLQGDDTLAVRDRHVEVVGSTAITAGDQLAGPASGAAREQLRMSLPDLRSALTHLVAMDRADELHRLLARLTFFWLTSGALTEGRQWYRTARRMGDGRPVDRVRSDLAAAMLAWWQGDYRDARRRSSAAEDTAHALQRAGEPVDVGAIDYVRATLAWIDGDLGDADAAIVRALERARASAPGELILAAAIGGSISWHRADHAEAVARYRECARAAGQLGNSWARDFARRHEALMLALAGDHEQSRGVASDLEVSDPHDRMSRGQILVLLAAARIAGGDRNVTAELVDGFGLAAAVVDVPTLLIAGAALAHLSAEADHVEWAAILLGWTEGVTALSGLPLARTEREHLDRVAQVIERAPGGGTLAALRHRSAALTPLELAGQLHRWPENPSAQLSASPK